MKTISLILGVVLIIAVGFIYLNSSTSHEDTLGSIEDGQGYYSTTTDSTFASGSTFIQLKIGSGILGSIIVSSTSPVYTSAAATWAVYDGVGATTTATSTLSRFPSPLGNGTVPHAAQGTYTYDAVFTKGLIVDVPPGFAGIYTVTWK